MKAESFKNSFDCTETLVISINTGNCTVQKQGGRLALQPENKEGSFALIQGGGRTGKQRKQVTVASPLRNIAGTLCIIVSVLLAAL